MGILHDIRCGFHSGIPACCIAFYLGPWSWVSYGRFPWLRARYLKATQDFNYIGCPLCLLRGRRVLVADCLCYMQYSIPPYGDEEPEF